MTVMAERSNGKGPYARRTHGSERRGVFSTPSITGIGYQLDQSRQDKAVLIEKFHAKRRAAMELEDGFGLGNKNLPAIKHKNEIIDAVEHNRAIVLGGETGSGKSTQVPQFLYEAGYDKVYVIVPRRVIADGLGERIREELVEQLGEGVGEHVGIVHGERVELHESNRIVIMTADTFNGMLPDIEAQNADKKVVVMADEIHEANLFIEIATGVAATAVQKHDKWRLIAASATHNIETLKEPFKKINGTNGEVPLVTIEGRPFKVELQQEPEKTPMQVYATFSEKPDRTMIFTSGKREIDYIIDKTREELESDTLGSSERVIFRKLHGDLTEIELAHIDDPVPEGYKLVIVSSPAGMSGITISGVTHVISDGTINRAELDADGVGGLRRYYLSRAGIIQQIGRAGRDIDGGIGILAKPITILEDSMCYRDGETYEPQMPFISFDAVKKSKHDKHYRLDHEPAEIYHSNLGRVVLRLAALNRRFGEINDYIPHPVTPTAIIGAEQSLSRLGALDDWDNITDVGRLMNRFPLSPELSRGVAEAYLGNRPLQHLARMAIIAAATEQGGLQDFSKKENRWKRMVRLTTDDDFIAQLDIQMGFMELEKTHGTEHARYAVHENDLHPKKMERSRKAARKILSVYKINLDNIVLTMPLPDEEALLRRDFTAGMVDLIYQDAGSRNKKRYVKNIHGDSAATERFISRTVADPREGALIAGFPRWFEKELPRGGTQHNDVVEQVLKVAEEDVVHYARQHGILTSRPLAPRVVGDKVLEQEQPTFGSIDIGRSIASETREYIPEETQKAIVRLALERQGTAQRAYRSLIDELEYYRNIIPEEELAMYRKSNAPEDITPKDVEALLRQFAKETRDLTYIDRKLAYRMYSKGVGIGRYYEDEARVEMQERSPASVLVGATEYQVFYDKGRPYVKFISREDSDIADRGVQLPDGRQVFLRMARRGNELHLVPFTTKENKTD